MGIENTWKLDSLEQAQIFEDKYAIRYVRPLKYRAVAFKYHKNSYKFSDTVAFYYEHYASQDDAIQAAKNWCLRGELERGEGMPYALAPGIDIEPKPVVEAQAW